jgi:predicted nucleic acid-binding protein
MPELVDTSVWVRRRHPHVKPWFDRALTAREVAVCDQVRLELLHSARNLGEFQALRKRLGYAPAVRMEQAQWDRVLDVYELLAGVSAQWHRSVKHQDLIIAACAEAAGLTLVHYDRDFDAIVALTGQPARWVAAPGSL